MLNKLSSEFENINDNSVILLKKTEYAIAPEDSFHLYGYYFSNTANQQENPDGERFCGIYLKNKKNIVIDGNNSTILIHGKMTPFIFDNCENITFKNFTIDHFRPTMSEMKVINGKIGEIEVTIAPEFNYRIENNVLIWESDRDKNGNLYWELLYKGPKILTNMLTPENQVKDMICRKTEIFHGMPDFEEITEIEKGHLLIKFADKNKYLKENTYIQTRSIKRLQTGGCINQCKNVILENITVHSMNCFGLLAQNSENLTYKSLNCIPKKNRTVVSDADFFHFSGCSGTINILNCKAKGAHDDIINVHGTHLKIIEYDLKNRSAVLRYSHPESWGFNPYTENDNVEFINGNTLLPYFTTTVINAVKLNNTDYLVQFEDFPDKILNDNDVIENITRTAELNVIGNIFEQIPSRAILCTTRKNVTVKNNIFKNMGGPVICVADDANFWFESGRSGNINFEDNTIINCAARENENDIIRYEPVIQDKNSNIPVHQSLTVKNNRFYSTINNNYKIRLKSLSKAEIIHNYSDVPIEIVKDNTVNLITDL